MESPPSKRVKLAPEQSPPLDLSVLPEKNVEEEAEDTDGEHCSICLQPYVDRTVIPTCSHEFCLECLLIWTEQSRRCPLCSQDIGKYLMHNIRSKYDYQKHYLAPLRVSPEPQAVAAARASARQRAVRRREIEWGRRRRREMEEHDELQRAIEKRKWVYRHGLYAKHVASNPYTRYRPFPTPAQFSASQDYISRATIFIRRELRVWTGLDVEFLTTFTISLMKSLDIRSEPAVRLLSEFLDMDADRGHERDNAEHFAHELYCYIRSPYRDLATYDNSVQYDVPPDVPAPDAPRRGRRWRSRSRSRSRPGSRSPRLTSRSPSSPRVGAIDSRSALQIDGDRRARSTSSHYASPGRRTGSSPRGLPSAIPASCSARPDDRHLQRSLPGREGREGGASPSGGAPSWRHDPPPEPRHSHRHREHYDGKGKKRADNRADDPDTARRPPPSREERFMTARGAAYAGINRNAENSSPSCVHGQSDGTPPHLSTSPYPADRAVTIVQDAGATSAVSRVASPITVVDNATPSGHAPPTSGHEGQASDLRKASTEGRPPVRARRNPWQTMQDYLSNGANGPRQSKPSSNASGAGRAQVVSSQVQQDAAASDPRDGALRPEDPSSSGETVPSLLSRLSEPTPPTLVRHPLLESRDTHLAALPAHEGGKRISAPEIMARARAPLARTSAVDEPSSDPSSPLLTHRPGSGAQPDAGVNKVEGGDVGAVELTSSEGDADGPKGATGPAGSGARRGALATSTDPRSLLMQKLAAEKRDAAGIPTAEKAPSSTIRRASVPMVLPAVSPGVGEEPSMSAQGHRGGAGSEASTRTAEQREAQLRSQAQLRLRLAAAKRDAAQRSNVHAGAGVEVAASETQAGPGGSTATIDGGGLAVQESALRARLRQARQA